MDLSKLSTDDLMALKAGDLSRVSTRGLTVYRMEAGKERLRKSNPAEYDSQSPEFRAKYGATAGRSATQNFVASYGKAAYDMLGRGPGQYLGLVDRQDVADSRARDAELLASRGGTAGNIVGSIATAIPTAFVPGANTVGGATAIGATLGALQPSTSSGETVQNTALGGGLGGISILAGRGVSAVYRAGKSLIEPLTEAGQQRIAARTLQAAAGGEDAARVAAQTIERNAANTLPGVQPTMGELSENAGLAQFQRSLRNNQELATPFAEREMANRAAMINAVEGISGDDAARAAAVAARDTAADGLYGTARQQGADASMIARANAAAQRRVADEMRALSSGLPAQADDQAALMLGSRARSDIMGGVDDVQRSLKDGAVRFDEAGNISGGRYLGGLDIGDLLKRPAIRGAISSARNTAANFGESVDNSNPVAVLHWAKKTLDGEINAAQRAGNNTQVAALTSARNSLLNRIESISPGYRAARETYQAMSGPINRMEIGQALRDKLVPALGDAGSMTGLRPGVFTEALRKGDDLAANVTGFSGAKLRNILTPDETRTLEQVSNQLARQSNANNLGRAAGSNTAQNLASQNFMRQLLGPLGAPNSLIERSAQSTLMQSVLRPAQFTAKLGEQQTLNKLAQAALDPKKAQAMLEAGVDPQVVGLLRYQGLFAPTSVSGTNSARQ